MTAGQIASPREIPSFFSVFGALLNENPGNKCMTIKQFTITLYSVSISANLQ